MIGRSIAMPAASKSPPQEVEREKGTAALGFSQSNCKRSVKKKSILERGETPGRRRR